MTEKYFSYTPVLPFAMDIPIVDVSLSYRGRTISVPALVDSGAALNILPYDYGLELGFIWEEQQVFNYDLERGSLNANLRQIVVLEPPLI